MQVVQGREGGAEGLPIDQVASSPEVAYRVSQLSVSGQGDQTASSSVTRHTTNYPPRTLRDVACGLSVHLANAFLRYSPGV